jgi:hypothetical protein
MIADPILTLAWLALAHLVADFVIQSNRVATDKFGNGMPAWRALGLHAGGVALCLVPFVLAFGLPGLALLIVVTVVHGLVDRGKVLLTRRAEAAALEEARSLREGPAPEASLGTAWTPMPAALFLLDQLVHAVVLLAAWAIFLAKTPVTDPFASAVNALVGSADPTTLQRVTLVGVILTDLAIVNVRAAFMFVAILVHPREEITGADEPAPFEVTVSANTTTAPSPSPAQGATQALSATPAAEAVPARRSVASPAKVGATIGIIERLLIVTLMLTNAQAAVGLVVAAKTIARFKQLDDRLFAEYYLLGTLASVSVAVVSGLVAAAALA